MSQIRVNSTAAKLVALISLQLQIGCSASSTPFTDGKQNAPVPRLAVSEAEPARTEAGQDASDALARPAVAQSQSVPHASKDKPGSKRRSEEDIRELAVRQLIEYRAQLNPLFFLAVDGDVDPDDAFLSRFADLKTVIRKGSRAVKAKNPMVGPRYSDSVTHEDGIRVSVGQIRWQGDGRAEVDCEIDAHARFYERATYVVEQVDSRWKIVRVKRRLVSSRQLLAASRRILTCLR